MDYFYPGIKQKPTKETKETKERGGEIAAEANGKNVTARFAENLIKRWRTGSNWIGRLNGERSHPGDNIGRRH